MVYGKGLKFMINMFSAEQEFMNNLRKGSKGRDLVGTGALQVFSFDDIDQRLSDEKYTQNKVVTSVIEAVISHALGPKDSYIKYSDTQYVIVFGLLTGDIAEKKINTITRECQVRLLGEPDKAEPKKPSDVGVTGVARDVRPSSIDKAEGLADLLPQILGKREGDAGHSDRGLSTVKTADDLDISWLPVWEMKQKALTTYRICIRDTEMEKEAVSSEKGVKVGTSIIDGVLADKICLEVAAPFLSESTDHKLLFLMQCPIHSYSVLRRDNWSELIEALTALPPLARKLLTLEILYLPIDTPSFRLLSIVSELKKYVRGVGIQIGVRRKEDLLIQQDQVSALSDAGVYAVGFDAARPRRQEGQTMEFMDRVAGFAEKCSLKTFVHGVDSQSLLISAKASGFSYISGPAISDPTISPKSMYRLALSDLVLA